MGLSTNHLRFLLLARAAGADLARPLMIGRQQLFLYVPSLQRVLADAGIPVTEAEAIRLLTEEDGFADPLFRHLGAVRVDAMDASPYEGASVLHDLNAPLPDALRARYSLVLDSGTLEHVFDFPRALASCMEMVAPGGHLVVMLPANNALGHGFYQFGPDLFWRALSPANGFRMVQCVVVEMPDDGRWYAVRDPAEVGARPEWHSREETQLMVCARRERVVAPFATAPHQSDYVEHWAAAQPGAARAVHGRCPLWPEDEPVPDTLPARLWRRVPGAVKRPYRALKRRVLGALHPPSAVGSPVPNPALFVPITPVPARPPAPAPPAALPPATAERRPEPSATSAAR